LHAQHTKYQGGQKPKVNNQPSQKQEKPSQRIAARNISESRRKSNIQHITSGIAKFIKG
jgi:hypothetical protein